MKPGTFIIATIFLLTATLTHSSYIDDLVSNYGQTFGAPTGSGPGLIGGSTLYSPLLGLGTPQGGLDITQLQQQGGGFIPGAAPYGALQPQQQLGLQVPSQQYGLGAIGLNQPLAGGSVGPIGFQGISSIAHYPPGGTSYISPPSYIQAPPPPPSTGNPCTRQALLNGVYYHADPYAPDKYIQCTQTGIAYEMPCAPNTLWNPFAVGCTKLETLLAYLKLANSAGAAGSFF